MNYISYWIPLTNTFEFDNISSEEYTEIPIVKNISDAVIVEESKLSVKLQKNKNIHFLYENQDYTLTIESSSNTGVLTYSYPNVEQNIKDIMEVQVYHYIKSYFHSHESHDDEVDALLHGYFTSLKPYKNDVIEHYCDIYQKKFESYYENIESSASVDEIIQKYKDKEYSIEESLELIAKVQNKIHKLKTELIYFKFLASSFVESNKKEYFLRECKNYLARFTILYQRYETLDNQFDTQYAIVINETQGRLAWWGIFLGVVLGGIGWYYGYMGATTENLNSKYKTLHNQNKVSNSYLSKTQEQDKAILFIIMPISISNNLPVEHETG